MSPRVKRGDELPKELARRGSRSEKIREAKAALEQEAREAAEKKQAEVAAQLKEREKQERERERKFGGRPPQAPDPEEAKREPKAQRNFTDPESWIMKDGATKEFVQAYNAQAAVDSHAQVIVGAAVTQEANDKKQLVPMLKEVKVQVGMPPQRATADNGYFSEPNITDAQLQEIDLSVAPDRQKHGDKRPTTTGPPPPGPAWPSRCGTSCGRRKGRRFINCARRWWNQSLDRSKRRAGFGDSCCAGRGKCRQNGR